MGTCRTENLTQATFPTRSGLSRLRIWHSFEKMHANATMTCARGPKRTQVGGENRLSVALHATRAAYTWEAIYQQRTRRRRRWWWWLSAGVFEAMVHYLRILLLRLSEGRASEPTATILDSRSLRSTPESGARAGYDGAKRKRGSKVHAAAVDTLGHLLALCTSVPPRSRTGSRWES